MAKDKKGRFVAGKDAEDFAPELKMEKYWNVRHYPFLTDAADSSVDEVTTIETGMEVQETGDEDARVLGRKWVVKAAIFQPSDISNLLGGFLGRDNMDGLQVSLQRAGVGAPAQRETRGVLGRCIVSGVFDAVAAAANGIVIWPLALDILTAIPVFDEQLEIVVRTAVDDAAWRNVRFTMSILYGWAAATLQDVIASRQLGA
jgi:hypothetical protein